MEKNEKSFDAVCMMRQIRDALGEQFKGMTFEEQKQYIDKHLYGNATQTRPNPDSRKNKRRDEQTLGPSAEHAHTGF